MIQINDYDLPITVAQKIITGTITEKTPLTDTVEILTGMNATHDMYSLDEIHEIAIYLMMYCMSHKEGD